jgi:hypothetical protein
MIKLKIDDELLVVKVDDAAIFKGTFMSLSEPDKPGIPASPFEVAMWLRILRQQKKIEEQNKCIAALEAVVALLRTQSTTIGQ